MPPTPSEIDPHLLEFARQVASIPKRISEKDNGVVAARNTSLAAPVTVPSNAIVADPGSQPADRSMAPIVLPGKSGKTLRTSREIGSLIMIMLREFGDAPEQGFAITVYGSNPWNTLLMIRPEAGPCIDRALWLSRVQDITMQLRNEFDIADEQRGS